MANLFSKLFRRKPMSDEEFAREKERLARSAPVPRLWLFGKTGSGKTSIVKCLTGAEDAEIGNGFRPETKFSREYAFPSESSPVLRFLDTRGLGEARYDPAEDLARFDAETQLVIVVVRVMDHALGEVIEPLRAIRRSSPHRPVLRSLTCLHETYPGEQHPERDPFSIEFLKPRHNEGFHSNGQVDGNPESATDGHAPPVTGDVASQAVYSPELARSMQAQRERFHNLVDAIAPIDLTRDEEGFHEPEFGGQRLKDAILALLPDAYRQSFAGFEEARKTLRSMNERRALPEIYSHSIMAATAAAVPVPWVDMPAVVAIQANMIRRIAAIYGQEMSSRTLLDTLGAAGGRMVLRFLVREPLKMLPFVGMAASAAMAFAYTYGLGRASCWYFGELRRGNTPTTQEVETVWKDAMDVAKGLWQKRPGGV